MAVLLALASALVYGAADFSGGVATRRSTVFGVVALSQLAGLLALAPLLPLLGGTVTARDLAVGAAAGLAGGGGLVLFYRALADGVMSVVAPVTAACAAAIPVLVGLSRGERIPTAGLAGIGLALCAIVLVSAEDGAPSLAALRRARLGPALGAGAAFGLFFVLLDATGDDSGLSPLIGARLASLALVVGLAAGTSRTLRTPARVVPLVLLAGVLDMSANALFLLATRQGLLAVTGLLASLYPASTVVLAQLVLRERLARTQLLGLGTALVAVGLISLASP